MKKSLLVLLTLSLVACKKESKGDVVEESTTEVTSVDNDSKRDVEASIVEEAGENDSEMATLTKKAQPDGGLNHWASQFVEEFKVSDNLPKDTKEFVIRLQFSVERDGSISDVHIVDDTYNLTGEAERTIKAIGKWQPAQSNGVKVRSKITQPITIRIN